MKNSANLEPFLAKIRRQNRTIRRQLREIQEDRDTITMILDNMQEGMVILNGEKKVLSVNRSAMHFLHPADRDQRLYDAGRFDVRLLIRRRQSRQLL